nr:calcium-binding protein [Alkalinema sp. FACHB-956]
MKEDSAMLSQSQSIKSNTILLAKVLTPNLLYRNNHDYTFKLHFKSMSKLECGICSVALEHLNLEELMNNVTYSNDYSWNSDWVYKNIVEQRGQTKVVFINGILTDEAGFDTQRSDVKNELKLKEWGDAVVTPGYGSLKLESFYNPSKGPNAEIQEFHSSLVAAIFTFAVNRYRDYWKAKFPNALGAQTPDGVLADKWALLNGETNNYAAFKLSQLISTPILGAVQLLQMNPLQKILIADFVDRFGDLDDIAERIGFDPPTDLMEALSQFFSSDPAPASKSLNHHIKDTKNNEVDWMQDVLNHLQNNVNNSVIFVPHSQGNFFVEDGLLERREDFQSAFGSRIKIISLGSPTNYSTLSLDSDTLSTFTNIIPIVDPVARLKIDVRASNKEKFQHLLDWLPNFSIQDISQSGFGVWIGHDLGRYLGKDLVLSNGIEIPDIGFIKTPDAPSIIIPGRQDVRPQFQKFAEVLNPKGYYFPNSPIFGKGVIEGTDDGDWLEGSDDRDTFNPKAGNDVVRGKSGSDWIIAGSGWDFIDGGSGEGNDFVQYTSWGHSITVYSEYMGLRGQPFPMPSSDIYRVVKGSLDHKGDVEEDILVDIEGIFGSNFSDKMNGGDGNDNFFGNDGNDQLFGNGSNDLLNGGNGNDDLVGGLGNDTIIGGNGEDTVYYTNSLNGVVVNINEDKAYQNNTGLRRQNSVNDANPDFYYRDLEPDFFVDRGEAQDGFGTVDRLSGLENIQGSLNNDILIGNQLDNKIRGLGGNDLLIGNAGNDILDGGAGSDTVSYRRDPYGVLVDLSRGRAVDSWGGVDILLDIENIIGSDSDSTDNLVGNDGNNIITAGYGNDYIVGLGGDDTIYGEFGNDTIIGGLGKDTIFGNQGLDIIWGDLEGNPDIGDNDYIRGGDGDDDIHAGGGDDVVFGDSGIGNDRIWGDAGNDELHGGAGNDLIEGGTGNDLIFGDSGADLLRGNSGADAIDGGEGDDLVDYGDAPSGVIVNIDESRGYNSSQQTYFVPGFSFEISAGAAKDGYGFSDVLKNLENIDGSKFADILIGNRFNNQIRGWDGNDILIGLAGDDDLQGQDGDDILLGGAGRDRLNGGAGFDIVSYRDATSGIAVSLYARSGWQGDAIGDEITETEGLEGSQFNDYLIGDNGRNILLGLGGDDILEGYAGDDTLIGGEGNDRIVGGLGNDIQIGGLGDDLHYAELGKDLIIDLEGNNIIDAGEGHNLIFAGAGNDRITAGPGNDLIDAGDGNNIIQAGEGHNWIKSGSGNDWITDGAGNDYILTGDGDDTIYLAEGHNIVDAGAGNNQIYSGHGNDLFILSFGSGTSKIFQFNNNDRFGLIGGMSFDQLVITEGRQGWEFFTQISHASTGDRLAQIMWTTPNQFNSSFFVTVEDPTRTFTQKRDQLAAQFSDRLVANGLTTAIPGFNPSPTELTTPLTAANPTMPNYNAPLI